MKEERQRKKERGWCCRSCRPNHRLTRKRGAGESDSPFETFFARRRVDLEVSEWFVRLE